MCSGYPQSPPVLSFLLEYACLEMVTLIEINIVYKRIGLCLRVLDVLICRLYYGVSCRIPLSPGADLCCSLHYVAGVAGGTGACSLFVAGGGGGEGGGGGTGPGLSASGGGLFLICLGGVPSQG
jgi:hypothetical protein